jgi:hypothetical protein
MRSPEVVSFYVNLTTPSQLVSQPLHEPLEETLGSDAISRLLH